MAGLVLYSRRRPAPPPPSHTSPPLPLPSVEPRGYLPVDGVDASVHTPYPRPPPQDARSPPPLPAPADTNTRPRQQQQAFLDLGQSDFSYSTCKTCGFLYARGLDEDEKLHSVFHMHSERGVPFKGWQKERVIMEQDTQNERIILVMHSDPLPHHVKVKEVTKIMEKELQLEPGWLLRSWCKVYLYISSSKVVGCIVVESISQANLLLLQEPEVRKPGDNQHTVEISECNVGKTKNNSSTRTLAFGNITFNREVVQRRSKSSEDTRSTTTDVFSNIAVPAVCGIRGLWVSRKVRRQGIATRLLDAVRSSFVYGLVVDTCQFALLQPTSDGRAFAQNYCKTNRILVYS